MASILNVDKIRRAAGSTDALVIDSGDRLQLPLDQRFHVYQMGHKLFSKRMENNSTQLHTLILGHTNYL